MSTFKRMVSALRATFADAHRVPVTVPSNGGYNPAMIQRPVIGVGNAPQYFLDAHMIARSAVSGGGTMITLGPPAPCGGPLLDWQTHTFGGPTQNGTLTLSRQLVGLAQPGDVKTVGDRR